MISTPAKTPRRKGSSRISQIPPEILRDLNRGRIETVTLVEWLAIDMPTLIGHAAKDRGLAADRARLVKKAKSIADLGISKRMNSMGAFLHESLSGKPKRERGKIFNALDAHPSDMVRAWAAYSVTADGTLDLAERLDIARRFAADSNMSTRECAWDSYRGYLSAELDRGLDLLAPWVID
ncbi:DNA alkylation repair protein, partial [bacterium]|nr:DNA alkylation repair protein [bacterium]